METREGVLGFGTLLDDTPPPPRYSGFYCAHFSIERGMRSNKLIILILQNIKVAPKPLDRIF